MADGDGNGKRQPPSSKPSIPKTVPQPRPTITLPPRPFSDALFNGGPGLGFSPGPMTLVSSFFSEPDEYRSFSQLLAGAMASPAASAPGPNFPPPVMEDQGGLGRGGGDVGSGFKQNKPPGLVIAQPPPMFTLAPGFSPATLLDSPGFGLFSPSLLSPFGMTHQQALAQVTAQAAQAHSQLQNEAQSSLSSASAASLAPVSSINASRATNQEMPASLPDSSISVKESSDLSHTDQQSQPSSFSVDKPADDGYNWRKYGQKQVKGSEYPRSYYKCTHTNCPVKKKVERSLDGQVTEIIYKGQHNHQPRQPTKRAKDAGNFSGNSNNQGNLELASHFQSGNLNMQKEGTSAYPMTKRDQESSLAKAEHFSGTSDSEEAGDTETAAGEKDEDQSDPKRRSIELRVSDPAASHRTVTEPRIILQTTSEVDLLDDGYRWRKYGQKVVKGNPYPRSYYKCTTPGCNVRKHVERASTDPKAVITTYEGKHNHDVPTAKTGSHNTANTTAAQARLQNVAMEQHLVNKAAFGNNNQQPVARLRLKEEQIT